MLETAEIFKEKGFTYVKGLADTAVYYSFINKLTEMGKGNSDKQVPGSRGFYKELIFEKLLMHLLPAVEQHVGCSLFKTYSYARQYHLGEELKPHRDRNACEITVSLCLGNEDEAWPIWIRDRDKQPYSFALEPGDAVIFRGIELKHWREPNTFGSCGQAFLHYVDQNGPHADERDDLKNNGH